MNSPEKNIPEKVLKLIIKELIKEGFDDSDMEAIYSDTQLMKKMRSTILKFGIRLDDYEQYGFFSELFIRHFENLDGQLDIPHREKFIVHFKVFVRRYLSEYWDLPYYSYRKSFISDMLNNDDISYYDGDLVDEDVTENETDDWRIETITKVKDSMTEGKTKKPLVKLDKEVMEELKHLQELKKTIEERIKLLTS